MMKNFVFFGLILLSTFNFRVASAQSVNLLDVYNKIDLGGVVSSYERHINLIKENFDISSPEVSDFMKIAMNRLPKPQYFTLCEPGERFNCPASVMRAIVRVDPIKGVTWLLNNFESYNNPIGIGNLLAGISICDCVEKFQIYSIFLNDSRDIPDGANYRICDYVYALMLGIIGDYKFNNENFPGKSSLTVIGPEGKAIIPQLSNNPPYDKRDIHLRRLRKWWNDYYDEFVSNKKSIGLSDSVDLIRQRVSKELQD